MPIQRRALAPTTTSIGAQPTDADLTTIAALDSTTAGALATDGSGWIRKTYAQLKTALSLTKSDVGLGNVDNTSDANAAISTATQAALDGKQPLDADLTTIAGLTATTDNIIQSVAGAWASRTPAQAKTALSLVKADVGLGSVDNTSDADKPLSTATLAAIPDTHINFASMIAGAAGSPVLVIESGRFPVWQFDASGQEEVTTLFQVPAGWSTFHVDVLWTNWSTGTGDVVWRIIYSNRTTGDSLAGGDVNLGNSTQTAPSQHVLSAYTHTATAISAGTRLFHARIARIAADAADTLGNDAALVGLRFRRAS